MSKILTRATVESWLLPQSMAIQVLRVLVLGLILIISLFMFSSAIVFIHIVGQISFQR